MKVYTQIQELKGKILHRWNSDGNRYEEYKQFAPTLYKEVAHETGYTIVSGEDVSPIKFNSIWDAKLTCTTYRDKGLPLHGQRTWHSQFITKEYPAKITEYSSDLLVVANIDIETYISDPANPNKNPLHSPIQGVNSITAITVEVDNTFEVFAYKEYTGDNLDIRAVINECNDEAHMLSCFLEYWGTLNPDIVIGWNIDNFDIPYLVGRIDRVLGAGASNRLSPSAVKYGVDGITVKDNRIGNGVKVNIFGITILDYMNLYKNYVKEPRERYSLNYIAYVELGDSKIDYSEYGNLDDLYANNFNLYIDYNIKDTEIVSRLDQKLKLIELICVFTYMMKIPHISAMSQVASWDSFICNKLLEDNIIVPEKREIEKSESFTGAYVLPIVSGLHKWVISCDLASLYPNIIRTFNIGVESIIDGDKLKAMSNDGCEDARNILNHYDFKRDRLKIKIDDIVDNIPYKVQDSVKRLGFVMSGSGTLFDQSKQSFLSTMMEELYNERKLDKATMIYHDNQVELIKNELRRRKNA